MRVCETLFVRVSVCISRRGLKRLQTGLLGPVI